MSAYQSRGKSDDWLTPKYVFDALGEVFDMDVAAPLLGSHVPAHVWLPENGLTTPWQGFVWMNPPFGHQRAKRLWLDKFRAHGNGIALMPDRTSAPWFQEFAPGMDALLFVAPKIKFERPDGTVGAQPGDGTCLMALGDRASAALLRAQHNGLGLLVRPA